MSSFSSIKNRANADNQARKAMKKQHW